MVLFFCTIYIFALIFREALGRVEEPVVTEMFDSVPRSIFTVFRCSFGDCSGPGGVPIFEHVQIHYGWVWSLTYCGFEYLITIGLFNVMCAMMGGMMSVQVTSLLRRLVRRYSPEP